MTEQGQATDRDDPLATALAVVPDDAVTDTEQHLNAPALVVRADRVQATLSALRAEAEFDRCACVTGQAYGDRDESIYHLRSDDNPTHELSVVVPVREQVLAGGTVRGGVRETGGIVGGHT